MTASASGIAVGKLIEAGLDLLDDGFAVFDSRLCLTYRNSRFVELCGYPPALAQPGTQIAELVEFDARRGAYGSGDAETRIREKLNEIARSKEPHEAERRLDRGRILRERYRPIPEGGFVLAVTDVTEARRIHEALRDAEFRYAQVTNALTEGIYEWTLATNQLAVSQRLAALVGFEQSEAQNLLWAERVHPDDMARYRAALVGHFRRQTARLECEYRLRIKSDEYRWFQDYGIGIRDDSGRVVRLLGAIRDIHERKKTEEALRLSEERYALAMEAVNESVFDWDLERKEVTYSTRFHAATLMGVGDEEVRDPQNWYRRIHPDDVPGYKTSLADHFKGNTPRWDCTYRYRAGDGGWRWARQHGMALRDSEGRAWRMIGAIGDVTAQAETEQALEQARGRLVQAEKMASLGRLTAGIAHEIKNPLNFVNNFAGLSVELLDELKQVSAPVVEALDDGARVEIDETLRMLTGNLEKIAEHGRRADNIVKSMLEHSRGVSGERREVDINALADEALKLAFHGARAQDQTFNITIERDFGPGLRAIELVPQDITRVFLNLFSNGFYAATRRQRDGGELEFRPVLTVTTRELGDAVEVRVRDNGIGIPPEARDKLFQPFFTTKPTGQGTGLGLSISYDIVTQEHGGAIAVESKPGAFTEFTIRLPRRGARAV